MFLAVEFNEHWSGLGLEIECSFSIEAAFSVNMGQAVNTGWNSIFDRLPNIYIYIYVIYTGTHFLNSHFNMPSLSVSILSKGPSMTG